MFQMWLPHSLRPHPRKNNDDEEEEGEEDEREEERRSNKKKAVAVYKTNWMLHPTSYQTFPEPPLVTRRLENVCLFLFGPIFIILYLLYYIFILF